MNLAKHVSPRRSRSRGAFSLIEMICVVGIIAILIALLMPAVTQARRSAKMATCASQMHQIYLASQNWKVENERLGNPTPMQANGWREEYSKYVKDLRVYNCPEDMTVIDFKGDVGSTGDTSGTAAPAAGSGGSGATGSGGAGGTGSTGTGSGGTGGSSGTPGSTTPPGDLADAFVRVTPGGGAPQDIPIKEGPWFKATKNSDGSTDLWLEDAFFQGGGDQDFKDIGVRVSPNSDGTSTVTLLKRPDGKSSSYRPDVMTTSPDGTAKTVFEDCYKGGTQAGATATLSNTKTTSTTGSDGTGTGTGTGTDGTGTGGTAGSGSPGLGGDGGTGAVGGSHTESSYGLNTYVKFVDGDSDKVFGMDYIISVIDPTKEDFAKIPVDKQNRPIFARHGGYANVLYGDGSVRPTTPTKTHLNPAFGDNRLTLWQK